MVASNIWCGPGIRELATAGQVHSLVSACLPWRVQQWRLLQGGTSRPRLQDGIRQEAHTVSYSSFSISHFWEPFLLSKNNKRELRSYLFCFHHEKKNKSQPQKKQERREERSNRFTTFSKRRNFLSVVLCWGFVLDERSSLVVTFPLHLFIVSWSCRNS